MEDDKQNTFEKMYDLDKIHTNQSVQISESYLPSGWVCYLFGATAGNGLAYYPAKGKVPNVFVRWMMKLCFDCTWVKRD